MDEPDAKRKRSEEGLLGLLGTYASDEEENDAPLTASPKKQKTDQGNGSMSREQSEEPLTDIAAVLAAANEREEAAIAAAAALQDAMTAEQSSPQAEAPEENGVAAAAEDPAAYDLPPELAEPPEEACPPDIQEKVSEYIRKQEQTGTTISSALRSLSGYRNPDFLQHCVLYDKISEYGSCYPPEVFDPNNLPEEDYYDRLAVEWQKFAEQQRLDRAKSQTIDFSRGGTETLGRSAAAGLNASSVAANIVAQAKAAVAGQRASKWDAKR